MNESKHPTVASVIIDAADIEPLISFWGDLLGLEEKMRFPGFVWLGRMGEGGPSLGFQQVPEEKTIKNRLHLDLVTDEPDAVIRRVIDLGGSRLADHEVPGFHWTVLADPAGNEFCVAPKH